MTRYLDTQGTSSALDILLPRVTVRMGVMPVHVVQNTRFSDTSTRVHRWKQRTCILAQPMRSSQAVVATSPTGQSGDPSLKVMSPSD